MIRAFQNAMSTRQVIRQSLTPIAVRGATFYATAFAVDSAYDLPPFLPNFRGEDDVFANTLSACFSDYRVGFAPLAINHAPTENRRTAGDLCDTYTCHIALGCLLEAVASFRGLSPWQRLDRIGRVFHELGRLRIEDFEEVLTAILARRAIRIMDKLSSA